MDQQLKRAVALELAQEIIARGEEVPLKTTGLSMGGTIRSGEWIVVRQVAPESIRCGDIVIFPQSNVFIAHRVIRRWLEGAAWCLQTKGDGHLDADAPISAVAVVARVVAIGRGDKTLRLDRGLGWTLSRLLWLYSWLVWRAYRLIRPGGRRRGTVAVAPRPSRLRRTVHAVLRWPTVWLGWLSRRFSR